MPRTSEQQLKKNYSFNASNVVVWEGIPWDVTECQHWFCDVVPGKTMVMICICLPPQSHFCLIQVLILMEWPLSCRGISIILLSFIISLCPGEYFLTSLAEKTFCEKFLWEISRLMLPAFIRSLIWEWISRMSFTYVLKKKKSVEKCLPEEHRSSWQHLRILTVHLGQRTECV